MILTSGFFFKIQNEFKAAFLPGVRKIPKSARKVKTSFFSQFKVKISTFWIRDLAKQIIRRRCSNSPLEPLTAALSGELQNDPRF